MKATIATKRREKNLPFQLGGRAASWECGYAKDEIPLPVASRPREGLAGSSRERSLLPSKPTSSFLSALQHRKSILSHLGEHSGVAHGQKQAARCGTLCPRASLQRILQLLPRVRSTVSVSSDSCELVSPGLLSAFSRRLFLLWEHSTSLLPRGNLRQTQPCSLL